MERFSTVVKNGNWTIQEMYDLFNTGKILKPKFQRESRWTIHPTPKGKNPSYSEYIKFLYHTGNTVHPLCFGVQICNNSITYINIDGNNRMNAIITFALRPLMVLREIFEDEIGQIKNIIDIDDDTLFNISLETLSNFNRLNNIDQLKGYQINKTAIEWQTLDDIFFKIQTQLKVNGKSFMEHVKINRNLFENGTYSTYSTIFKSINQYTSQLSEGELLASVLFNSQIEMTDTEVNRTILANVNKYYAERDKNEILSYVGEITMNNMNAFDVMIGTQEYMHVKTNGIVPKHSPKGLGLIFKIFKLVKGIDDIDECSFADHDMSSFISSMCYVSNILARVIDKIKHPIKDDIKWTSFLKKNNVFLLVSSILGLKKEGKNENYIVSSLCKTVLYHILCNGISKDTDPDELSVMKERNKLKYEAGGSYITNICNKIYRREPDLMFRHLTREMFEKVLYNIFNVTVYNPTNDSKKKRSYKSKKFYQIIMGIIYKRCIPSSWLDKPFSLEHLIPFSSMWEDELDINRFGNIFPMPLEYNKNRLQYHISKYETICPEINEVFIKRRCSIDVYNSIVEYVGIQPSIIDNDKYNEMCTENETKIVNVITNLLFTESSTE